MLSRLTNYQAGITFRILNILSICSITILSKHLIKDLPILQVLVLYKTIAFGVVIVLYHKKIKEVFTSKFEISFLIRGAISFVSLGLWFYATDNINLTQATSITYLTPIFTTIIAGLALGEKFRMKYVMATLVGFFGTILILQPSIGEIQLGHLAALGSALSWSIYNNLLKRETKISNPTAIVFYTFLASFIIAGPSYFFIEWQPIGSFEWGLIIFTGCLFVLNFYCLMSATAALDLIIIMPLSYLKIIINSIFAYVIFSEAIDYYSYFAASIIVIGNYLIYRKNDETQTT